MSRRQKFALWIAAGVAAVSVSVWAAIAFIPAFQGKRGGFQLDVGAPDALIVSSSLSALPRDLLAVPLLKDTLSEDFVFYYEQHEDRLSLAGTLKRIAYEHNESLSDQIVEAILAEPTEVALWKGKGGKLDHYLLAARRTTATRLTELAVKLAGNDEQVQKAGDITLANGSSVTVYVLLYGRDRQLYFTAQGDRLLAASDAALLVGGDGESRAAAKQRVEIVSQLLQAERAANPYLKQFRLENQPASRHSIAVSARYLSLGYADLFRGIEALRFDFGDGRWSTAGLFDPTRAQAPSYDGRELWQSLPANAALCSAGPMNWPVLQAAMQDLSGNPAGAKAFAHALKGPVAVCWYASSRYYTPLLVASVDSSKLDKAYVKQLFDSAIGPQGGKKAPVTVKSDTTATIWQREVPSVHGFKAARSGKPRFVVSAAQQGNVLLFSPDEQLLTQALAVGKKQFPAMADSLPVSALLFYVNPRDFARLLEKEALTSLPAEEEPVFNTAAKKHLLPKLAALGKYPAFALSYPKTLPAQLGWQPLSWVDLPKSAQ